MSGIAKIGQPSDSQGRRRRRSRQRGHHLLLYSALGHGQAVGR